MFEFDVSKSIGNKEKHGIDFEEAKALWNDPSRLIIQVKTISEERYLMIAKLGGSIWSAIYTIRDKNLRIISVRKSRENEKEIYNSL
jgi:uncharacterized protein